jgi:NTE family protein
MNATMRSVVRDGPGPPDALQIRELPIIARRPEPDRNRTAFVLSGGGSLGASQVGMSRALYEREIAPDVLVGTSVGALNAAFIASRPQTVETADQLADIWCRLGGEHLFPFSVRALLVGLAGREPHEKPSRDVR